MRRGFTILEVMIVLVILGILLALAGSQLRSAAREVKPAQAMEEDPATRRMAVGKVNGLISFTTSQSSDSSAGGGGGGGIAITGPGTVGFAGNSNVRSGTLNCVCTPQ